MHRRWTVIGGVVAAALMLAGWLAIAWAVNQYPPTSNGDWEEFRDGYCTYDMGDYDYGKGVAVAADGSVYLIGRTESFGANTTNAFLAKYDAAGTQLWNRIWGGTDFDNGSSVMVAADGSVYLAGSTRSFGIGSSDAFLAKYNAAGTQLWNCTWGGADDDYGEGVAVAADGSVYLSGTIGSFGTSRYNAFLVKYSPVGTGLWNCTWGGADDDYGEGVAVAADGSVYLAGWTHSFGVGYTDASLIKYNSTGSQLWNRTWGGSDFDRGQDVAVAADGSVFLAGWTHSFGAGIHDAFLAKFNAAGAELWNHTWGRMDFDYGSSVAVTADGSAYLAGSTYGFGNGYNDAFLTKYNSAGTQLWNRTWGGADDECVEDVAVAADGSVYLAGYTGSFIVGFHYAFLAILDGSAPGDFNGSVPGEFFAKTVLTIGVLMVVGVMTVITVASLHAKRRVIAGHVRSMRETIMARRHAPGKVEEVVYRGHSAGAANLAGTMSIRGSISAICSSCGRPLPAGVEKGKFCIFCGKALG